MIDPVLVFWSTVETLLTCYERVGRNPSWGFIHEAATQAYLDCYAALHRIHIPDFVLTKENAGRLIDALQTSSPTEPAAGNVTEDDAQ